MLLKSLFFYIIDTPDKRLISLGLTGTDSRLPCPGNKRLERKQHYLILIGWFIKLSGQTFQTLIVICRLGNFVCHHSECTLKCRSLSYPFRYLGLIPETVESMVLSVLKTNKLRGHPVCTLCLNPQKLRRIPLWNG